MANLYFIQPLVYFLLEKTEDKFENLSDAILDRANETRVRESLAFYFSKCLYFYVGVSISCGR